MRKKGFILDLFSFLREWRDNGDNYSEDVGKRDWVLNRLNLHIKDGETLALLGPSGCGKTTLLRAVAGLEPADEGEILFDGIDIREKKPEERKIGMVFQNYALYPHLTSKKNIITYFLFKKQTPELQEKQKEIFRKTSEILGVDIQYLLNKTPRKLSGGERQRVAIGRCITREPELFLLDEPFTNLDAKIREQYRIKLKKLLVRLRTTALYVTHDQQEAMLIGDRVAVMRRGNIVQTGTYEEIYLQPVNMFVADFLSLTPGQKAVNFFKGRDVSEMYKNEIIGVRSEDLIISPSLIKSSLKPVEGKIEMIQPLYANKQKIVVIKTENGEVNSQVPIETEISQNQIVYISFSRYHVFDMVTELRKESVGFIL